MHDAGTEVVGGAGGDTRWFTRDRFGLFIHWGLYALPARHEWIKQRERIRDEDYQQYFDHFDPDLYDPAEWARDARAAGVRYAIITAKHHEGFCLWDSALTDYKAPNTPAGRDLLRPWVEAFRAEGLKIGFYYSLIDWHHPEFPIDGLHPRRDDRAYIEANAGRDMAKYRAYLFGQVRELLETYAPDILWLDFSYPGRVWGGKGRDDWHAAELVGMVRELAPDIILNDRLDLPESADIVTPEQYQPRAWPSRDGRRVVWEACQTLNGSWGYDRDNLQWKSPELVARLLVDTVAKGGNLLLNVGPTARGEFDPRARALLAEVGAWLRRHGRAIYGCTASDLAPPPDCRYTRRGDRLYLHVFAWPYRHLHLDGLAGQVAYAQLLHDGSEVAMPALDPAQPAQNTTMPGTPGALTLELPVVRPDVLIPVVELFLKG